MRRRSSSSGQRIHKRVGAPEPAAGLSWPKALRAVQAWPIPWSMLVRCWRSWSPAPPPGSCNGCLTPLPPANHCISTYPRPGFSTEAGQTPAAFLRQQAAGIVACDLLHDRDRLAAAPRRAVLYRAGHPPGPSGRGDRQPGRRLGRPAGPQPAAGAGRAKRAFVLRDRDAKFCRASTTCSAQRTPKCCSRRCRGPTRTPSPSGGSAQFAPSASRWRRGAGPTYQARGIAGGVGWSCREPYGVACASPCRVTGWCATSLPVVPTTRPKA
jgi:hypothetical protein